MSDRVNRLHRRIGRFRQLGRGSWFAPARDPAVKVGAPDPSIGDIIHFSEVTGGRFFAAELFRRKFGAAPPDVGRHFVALYRPGGGSDELRVLGYVHQNPYGDSYLTGGFCIDELAYRRMPPSHRSQLRAEGGIAEKLMRYSLASLPEAVVFWGYVGNSQARNVDLRVGFESLDHAHLMALWNKPLTPREKATRIQAVKAVGPF